MASRLAIFLVSGALLMIWIAPPEGIYRYALIVAWIMASAYVDAWTRGWRKALPVRGNVVQMPGHRRAPHRAGGTLQTLRERRSMALVFGTYSQAEADELAVLLRGESMHPVVVTSQLPDRPRAHFEIRLPPREAERAQAMIKWFKLRAGKHPN
jgi:hypothetical protein